MVYLFDTPSYRDFSKVNNGKVKMRKGVIIFVSSIIFIYCQSVSAQNVVDSLGADSLIRQLPEVMIKGEHPLAVVHGML